MTETNSGDGVVVMALVYEEATAGASCRSFDLDVDTERAARSDRADSPAGPGTMLSRDLLGQVDLTPKAEEPQESWGWEIAAYLYLGGLGAAAFIVTILLDWTGLRLPSSLWAVTSGWDWDWGAVFFYWAVAATALGALFLIPHLGRNWFLFFTACLNPRSSWMARGFLILTTFIVLGGLTGVAAVFFPDWPGTAPAVWRALQALALLAACALIIYTGVLMSTKKYIPAWHTTILPPLIFASALSIGAMGIAVGALLFGLVSGEAAPVDPLLRRIEVVHPAILAVEAVLLALYLRQLARGKPEAQLSFKMLTSGSWRHAFWVGVVGAALVVPLIVGGILLVLPLADPISFPLFGAKVELRSILVLVSAVAALGGGFLLRLGILAVGIKQRPPLYGLSVWRAEHALPIAALNVDDATAG